VAISNRRLLSLTDGRLSFLWKDYANGNQNKTINMDAIEFIRRFLLHVLPSRFVHIRHFGFLANRTRKEKLALCRSLLPNRPTSPTNNVNSPNDVDSKTTERVSRQCPICKVGRFICIELLSSSVVASLPAPIVPDTS
jgi:hypothetical protein